VNRWNILARLCTSFKDNKDSFNNLSHPTLHAVLGLLQEL